MSKKFDDEMKKADAARAAELEAAWRDLLRADGEGRREPHVVLEHLVDDLLVKLGEDLDAAEAELLRAERFGDELSLSPHVAGATRNGYESYSGPEKGRLAAARHAVDLARAQARFVLAIHAQLNGFSARRFGERFAEYLRGKAGTAVEKREG